MYIFVLVIAEVNFCGWDKGKEKIGEKGKMGAFKEIKTRTDKLYWTPHMGGEPMLHIKDGSDSLFPFRAPDVQWNFLNLLSEYCY